MTRKEHVENCKKAARVSLEKGDSVGAILDMVRLMPEHPECAGGADLFRALAADAMRERTLEAARRFVEGFN